jgi:hypothetical protein
MRSRLAMSDHPHELSRKSAWSIDGWATAREAAMHPVGGVMAGAARYAITLGPFSAGTAVRFRFRCQHPDCDGDSPCCRGDERVVTVAGVD